MSSPIPPWSASGSLPKLPVQARKRAPLRLLPLPLIIGALVWFVVTAPSEPAPAITAVARSELWIGRCHETSPGERTRDTYEARRDRGSARRLRGRVAMLHVRFGANAWPHGVALRVDEAALISQRFYMDQAAQHGVTDLVYDVIPWSVVEPFELPALAIDGTHRLDHATSVRLRGEARRAVTLALGMTLDELFERYKADGYDEIGLVVYLPLETTARSIALSATRKDSPTAPELAFITSPSRELAELAVVVSHEGLHLFGADDLYAVRPPDGADRHDVMAERCTGFGDAVIGSTTAFAVGWIEAPGDRAYGIVER